MQVIDLACGEKVPSQIIGALTDPDYINIFGAKVININSCGISVYNLSTYAGEHQLHPNAAGHVLMAKEVISELLK